MDLSIIVMIVAGGFLLALIGAFMLRKFRMRRYHLEVRTFTHDILTRRLRALNDQVRQSLYLSLERIHLDDAGGPLGESLIDQTVESIFPAHGPVPEGVVNEDDAAPMDLAWVRDQLEQSWIVLEHVQKRAEQSFSAVEAVVKRNIQVFRGPVPRGRRSATSPPVEEDEEDSDLTQGKPEVARCFCVCGCITIGTQKEILRNYELLHFYNLSNHFCCGRPYRMEDDNNKEAEVGTGGRYELEFPAEKKNNNLVLRVGDVTLNKMLHMGHCLSRHLMEITGHAKQFVTVKAAKTAGARMSVDVKKSDQLYSSRESKFVLDQIFQYRHLRHGRSATVPVHSDTIEDLLHNYRRDAEKKNRRLSNDAAAKEGGAVVAAETDDEDDGNAVSTHPWVTLRQDRIFFSANGLRDDLFVYFHNMRRVLLSSKNTDKASLGMYDAVRVFDIGIKTWMLSATKVVTERVALEWKRRVLLRARDIVVEERKIATDFIKSDALEDAEGKEGAADDAVAPSAATEDVAKIPFARTPPSVDELVCDVLYKWLTELQEWFAQSVAVPPLKTQHCCGVCVPSYPAVVCRFPDTDVGVLKGLQQRLKQTALKSVLSDEQKQLAKVDAAPTRKRLVDLLLPTTAVVARSDTPPPPPPAPQAPVAPAVSTMTPEPPPRRLDVAEVGITFDDDEGGTELEQLHASVGKHLGQGASDQSERSIVICDVLRKAMDDVSRQVEEAMEKVENDLGEHILLSSTNAQTTPYRTGPSAPELKQFFKFVKHGAMKRLTYVSKHLSLMMDCHASSRVLCAAAQGGKSASDVFKAQLLRFHQQLENFKRNLLEWRKESKSVVVNVAAVMDSLSIELTATGLVLGKMSVFDFVPMPAVVATYLFHAGKYPKDVPQDFSF